MSRPNPARRAAAKARKVHRVEAAKDMANGIQSGPVRSIVQSYAKHAHLSSGPSLAFGPDRYVGKGGKTVSQAKKPRTDAPRAIVSDYAPSHGRTNLTPKTDKVYGGRPDPKKGRGRGLK